MYLLYFLYSIAFSLWHYIMRGFLRPKIKTLWNSFLKCIRHLFLALNKFVYYLGQLLENVSKRSKVFATKKIV